MFATDLTASPGDAGGSGAASSGESDRGHLQTGQQRRGQTRPLGITKYLPQVTTTKIHEQVGDYPPSTHPKK